MTAYPVNLEYDRSAGAMHDGFAATELWGPDADPAQICHLDLFETYLQPATA